MSSTKYPRVAQGFARSAEEHSGVHCKTFAVVESFNQVQKSPQLPEGESVPDFEAKLRPITAQQGDNAAFKANVTGNPQPSVSWERASGFPLSVATKSSHDNIDKQHILKIKNLTLEDADVYKCAASNKHRDAAFSISLSVTENPPMDFKKMLKKRQEHTHVV
ncbi:immunoglobulin superfamily member 22-like [Oreochromis aureus]|uniref:immunoglobulin superfamily member 22-like n=1 Tax=Oreochromis aureus TaxID=47969 RepID=UPI001953A803|nr:immunoglobulin superfamily member 22-like [Oreochromis aureus]